MMIKGHLMVATSVYLLINEHIYSQPILSVSFFISFAFILLGALLPDIDYPNSYIGKRVKTLSYPIYFIFGHRKLTHSAIFVLTLYYLSIRYQALWLSFIAIGASLHILGDYLTHSGVPLLYPFGKNYRFVITIPTNSYAESVVAFSLLSSSILYVVFQRGAYVY